MCAGLIQEWISHLNYPACKGGEVWQILSRYRIGYIGFNRYRIGNLWISPIPIYRYYRQALGVIGIGYSPKSLSFVGNAVLAKVRSSGKIALAVASSGIASTLLDGGRTAHSRFKLPGTHRH